ncbi:tetratricopeptide repeat protein [Sinomonas sp. G460-2]|uniref:tetratricopeptide repeat protein n=1 Tax=Sinomonas sp. G460-2 TaxID=3393464 RepID=UPI0039EE26E4
MNFPKPSALIIAMNRLFQKFKAWLDELDTSAREQESRARRSGAPAGHVIGAETLRAYSALQRLWDDAKESGPMRFAVVKGGPGSGKTMLLELLYQHCAMTQSRPKYWPDALSPTRPRGGGPPGAGDIFPDPVKPEKGSRLWYFWWGLRGSTGRSAAIEGQAQLMPHLDPINDAVREADRLTQIRLRALLDTARLLETFLPVPGIVSDVVAPFLDGAFDGTEVAKKIGQSFQTPRGLIDRALAAGGNQELSIFTEGATQDAASNNAREIALASGLFPWAIVVDDAEALDPITTAMLKTIRSNQEARGLMVLAMDAESPFLSTTADADGKATKPTVLVDWLAAEERSGTLSVTYLRPMEQAEMNEIGLQYLQATGAQDIDAASLAGVVAASHGSPGRLLSLLGLPAVREPVLGAGSLPPDLDLVAPNAEITQRFNSLPEKMRILLAEVSLAGWAVPARWLVQLPGGHPSVGLPMTPAGLQEAISTGWIKDDQSGFVRFHSEAARKAALGAVPRHLTPERQRGVLQSVAEHINTARADGSWTDFPPAVCESLLTALTSETARRCDFQSAGDWEAELIRIRLATGRTGADETTIARLEERLRTGRPSAAVVAATAEALFDAGHTQRGLDLLEHDLSHMAALYGVTDLVTLSARWNLAAYRAAMARTRLGYPDAPPLFELAIAEYRGLIDALEGGRRVSTTTKVRNEYSDKIMSAHNDIAHILAGLYRFREAANEIAQYLHGLAEHPDFGPDHPKTIPARIDFACWTGEADDPARACELLTALVPDSASILGPEHRYTLSSRGNLAYWIGEAGDAERARDLFAELVRDYQRVLGPNHPETLSARANLASYTGEAGDPAEARDLFETLVPDYARVLGPDHPATLMARANLASYTGEAGDPAEARDLLETLVPDRTRVLGPDHLHTLHSRNDLASYAGVAGDPARARDLLEALVSDCARALGPEHADTLQLRGNLAYWIREAGNPAQACELLKALASDCARAIGPNHPLTLRYLKRLADWQEALTGAATDEQ